MPNAQAILERKGPAVTTIEREATVLAAAKLMNERRIGALVVISGDRAVGIFTERDILNRVVAASKDPEVTPIGDVMTTPMVYCHRETSLEQCKTIMSQKRIRHLPVVEEGRLFGLISSGDILAGECADQQAHIEYLHEYLYGHR